MTSTAEPSHRPALYSMLAGNFLIGTGILLPAGLLNDLSREFATTPDVVGWLPFVGGLVVAIGAPFFATWTSRIGRRSLLTAMLLLYAVGHFASALAPTFDMQIVIRAVTAVGAAVFTPQAAATVGLLMPPEKRPATISFIFIGWSAATACGVPLANYLSTLMDWRMIYGLVGGLCLIGAYFIWRSVPAKLFVQPLGLAAWRQAFSSPILWMVYIVTALSMAAQFTMLTYMAPLMRDGFHVTAGYISLAFAAVGVAGVIGNSLASRFVPKVGTDNVIAMGLAALALGFLGFGLFHGSYWLAILAAIPWGLGSFSSNSLQQSRLATLAPAIASVTIALNTSFVYVGQSAGARIGGALIRAGEMPLMGWAAMGLMILALVLSLLATRLSSVQARR